ncbi:MAG TPA: ABC transporter permease [Rhodanobacter sp.]|nr:ABC transporter permease [Rhodanobacter sp.]
MAAMTRWRSDRVWSGLRTAICVLVAIYMLAPMVVVVVISFSSAAFLHFPPPGLSLQWYRRLFATPEWTSSLLTSVEIMLPTGLLATGLGTAAAVGLARARFPGAALIGALLMAPMVVPVIIIAAAVYTLFGSWDLNGTLQGLILAHTLLTVPYVMANVRGAMETVDRQLENAALTLGATPWRGFWRITFPLILPGVLSGLLFAMVVSFDELIVSLFISTPEVRPVTVQMWSDVRGAVDPTISAIATVLFAVSFLLLLADFLFRRHAGTDASSGLLP